MPKENDKKEYKNNSAWIIDEFTEWIDKAVISTAELCDKSDVSSREYSRLLEKNRTLIMVQHKLKELKND